MIQIGGGYEKRRLRRWDEILVKQNNLPLDGAFTVQFYPENTRQILRQIEGQYLAKIGRQLKDVRRTFFKVIPSGSGFEFKLTEMNFRL